MKIVKIGDGGCERVRRYLDSYVSSELSVESNHDVLQHLEHCIACSRELELRLKVRATLKNAVRRQDVPPGLETRIRGTLRASADSDQRPMPLRYRWIAAMASVVLLIAAVWLAVRGRREADPAQYEAYLGAVTSRVAEIFQVGLRDHVHCAVLRKYPKNPPPAAEMTRDLGAQYAALLPLIQQKMPAGARVIMAHRCTAAGRRYVHVVLRDGAALLSLVITRKNAGESLPGSEPINRTATGPFQVAAFDANDYLAYVISDLPAGNNWQIAEAFAPGVRELLKSAP